MKMLEFYAAHSPYTQPARWGHLLDELPGQIPELCKAIQGLVVHYRASGLEFPPERLAEIDTRWAKGMLETLQARDTRPLNQSREPLERLVGCCRDTTLLFVAALRQKGIPARSRVGFATYFDPDFNRDHVVGEYWNGQRWVMVDAQIRPEDFPFEVQDMPREVFPSAAEVWQGFRQGRLDVELYGVAPRLPWKGGWFVRNYVVKQLAHLCKHELLLWDEWGLMSDKLDGDLEAVGVSSTVTPESSPTTLNASSSLEAIDRLATLLLRGDAVFEEWLEIFQNPAFQVPSEVLCFSPTGNIRPVALT
jgi:hypothetical protein